MNVSVRTTSSAASGGQGRLGPDDALFVAMEHVVGLPVVNQIVWLAGPDVDEGHLAGVAGRLRTGRLSRLVVRSGTPARDRWRFSPEAGRYRYMPQVVPAAGHGAWAHDRLDEPLDSAAGPGWRLTAAPTDDGRTLVSLTFAHAVGDGGAVLAAIDDAVRGVSVDVAGPRATVLDEVRDAASSIAAAVVAGIALAASGQDADADASSPEPSGRPDGCGPDGVAPIPSVAVTVDASAFHTHAAEFGGTANSLLVALVLSVLHRSGRVGDGAEVPVSLPMSTRTAGDLRANATSAATARIGVDALGALDLTGIRQRCRQAFAGREAAPDRVAQTAVLAQVLPDAVVRGLARGMTLPLCLASNLGRLPESFATLGGSEPAPVAMRSVTTAAARDRLVELGGGVSAWLAESGDTVTLSFTSLDPVHTPDSDRLLADVLWELGRRGLAAEPWLH